MAELETKSEKTEKKGKKGLVIKIVILLIVAAVVVVGALFFMKMKKGSDANDEGVAAYENGDYNTAIDCFKEALNYDSKNATYTLNLGLAYMGKSDYNTAIDKFESVLDSDNKDEFKEKANYYIGKAYMQEGSYDSAIKYLEAALLYVGKTYTDDEIDMLYYLADAYSEKGNHADQILTYNKILNQREDVLAYTYRGLAYNNAGDIENATKDLEKAIDMQSSDINVYISLYHVLVSYGRMDDANNVLLKALDIDTNSDEDAMNKGIIYIMMKDLDKAENIFASVVKNGGYMGHIGIGIIRNMQGNFEEAAAHLEEYFSKSDGNNARACNEYGVALMKLGRPNEAEEYLVKGIGLNDNGQDKALRYNLACVYEAIHDWDRAYDAFNEYLIRYPDDEQAKKELYFIESRQIQ